MEEIWRVLDAAEVAAVVVSPDGRRRATQAARRRLGALADDAALERSAEELGLELRCVQLEGGTAVALLRDVKTPERVLHVALHDLRSPIANARTYVSMLLRGKLPAAKVPHTLESLARSADRALALINAYFEDELLRLRPDGIERHPADVGQLLDRVVAAQRPLASERGVKLEWTAAPATAEVDADALAHALGAVLERALARTPPEGAVRVHLRDGADELAVVIHDSGPAPAGDELEFDRDARIVAEKRLQPALGLHLAKAELAAHGGRLQIRAESGGATWQLAVPKHSS